jgi:hypothetical protein
MMMLDEKDESVNESCRVQSKSIVGGDAVCFLPTLENLTSVPTDQ